MVVTQVPALWMQVLFLEIVLVMLLLELVVWRCKVCGEEQQEQQQQEKKGVAAET